MYMDQVAFNFSPSKQRQIGWFFLFLAILGITVAAYQWFFADPSYLMVVVGGVVLGVIGIIMFVKLLVAPRRNDEMAIRIDNKGILATTSPIAKGAGLIAWRDITDIQIHKRELVIWVSDPKMYAARIKNFFVRDTFLKTNKGVIRVSFIEVDVTPEQLSEWISQYSGTNNDR